LPDGAKGAIGTHTQHRFYHLLSFGSTAYLLTLIARDARERFYGLLFVVLLGVLLETGQYLVFNIHFEWWDVRDDTIGVLAAALLAQSATLRQKLVR
jgi:hypothetical protein